MSVCYIFSGGIMGDNDLSAFKIPDADYVISADAGYLYVKKHGFETDCLIGDFDTLENLPDDDKYNELLKFKSEKDDTDTMLAVRHALEKDFDEIYIFGALGGRFDHTFSNVQTLNFIASHGKKGFIVSENEFITVLNPGEYTFDKLSGYSFSVFSLSDKAEGVCERGFKYSLDNATIENSFPVGVCNEFIEEKGVISFKSGKILIVISKKQNLFYENE